jgi:membrane-bound lytic murein transglycosylase B
MILVEQDAPMFRLSSAVCAAILMIMPTLAVSGPAAVETSLRPVARPAILAAPQAVVTEVKVKNAGFSRWIDGFQSRARAKGISQTTLTRAFRGVQYDPDVIKRDRNQSEFTKTIWDYLDSAASETRIKNGKKALRQHRKVLGEIEARYGVPAEVVVAVWGLESAYGEFKGSNDVIQSLATLAYDGRRGKFFEAQLLASLKILQNGDVNPRSMTGSWAGAMGHTQFIPTSYLAYAVDVRGDGKRDIWSNDPTDALASTGAYLARHGWVKGQPWGVEVILPKGFNFGLTGMKTKKSPAAWAQLGVRDITGKPVPNHGTAAILMPGGAQGAAFMIFKNFNVIERYNAADAYVIGVGHLSDRIMGGPAIQSSWPRQYLPLKLRERKELQRRLTRKGFDTQGVDGKIGPNTISAIRDFQKSIGVTPDGYASIDVLKRLR